MGRLNKLIDRLRLRFTDWTPENITITPAPKAEPPAITGCVVTEPPAKKPPKAILWRFALVASKSGMTVLLEVGKDGHVYAADARRLGIERVPEWDEVRARSRTEAKKLIAKGKAEHRTAVAS